MKLPRIEFNKFITAGKWLYEKYDNLSPEQKEKLQELVKKLAEKVMKKDEE